MRRTEVGMHVFEQTYPLKNLLNHHSLEPNTYEDSREVLKNFFPMWILLLCSPPSLLIRELTQEDFWKTQDGRTPKKCRVRLCIPNLTRQFFRDSAVLSVSARPVA